jgi:hypothetical protein
MLTFNFQDLTRARATVVQLRGEMDADQARLARLSAEQRHAIDERDEAMRQLRRTREVS